MNELFIYIIIFIFSLAVGSFLNVCIYRLPREKSIISPPSFCPNCKQRIKWFDNIPVVSFVILKGKCRYCRAAISVRYPAVEILTAIIFCLNFFFFGFTFSFWVWCLFLSSLIVISFIDLKFQIIPEIITIGGIVVGLGLSFFYPEALFPVREKAFLNSLLGILIGGGSIYLVGLLGNLLFRKKIKSLGLKESMGFGDVELMAMIGAFLGWKLVILCFLIAPILGSVVGLAVMIKRRGEIIPYGPFLSLASLVCLYWGRDVLKWFLMSI